MEIPVKKEAKYLGVPYNTSLNPVFAIKKFKPKQNYIYYRLFPILKVSEFRLKYNLWQIFIAPLYRMIISSVGQQRSLTARKRMTSIITAARSSLKKFTLVPKWTDNKLF